NAETIKQRFEIEGVISRQKRREMMSRRDDFDLTDSFN
ncbi:hypothetical protein D046_3953B, partial [Vibrio parahaemolyticus V-223/04]